MNYQNTSYSQMSVSEEISITYGQSKDSTMYSVAKYSDDEGVVAAFVHNKNKQSLKYGYCFTVHKNGSIFTEDFDSGELIEVSLLEACFRISDSPISTHQSISNTLKDIVLGFGRVTELQLNKDFIDQHFYSTLNHRTPSHTITTLKDSEITDGVFVAASKNTLGITYQVKIDNDNADSVMESISQLINLPNSVASKKFQGILIYSELREPTADDCDAGITLHAFVPMLVNGNDPNQLLSDHDYINFCASELKSEMDNIATNIAQAD